MAMYIHPRCECDTHDEEANGRVGASRPERWLGGVLHPVRLPGIDMLWSPLPLVLLPSHASAAAREGLQCSLLSSVGVRMSVSKGSIVHADAIIISCFQRRKPCRR